MNSLEAHTLINQMRETQTRSEDPSLNTNEKKKKKTGAMSLGHKANGGSRD